MCSLFRHLMIINRYKGPSLLGAEFVGAELVRGRVSNGPSLLGAEMSSYQYTMKTH